MYPAVGDVLELATKRHPDREALRYPHRDQRWTYAELDARVNRLANALADRGVGTGDRVSTVLHNGSEIVLVAFASAKLGAVFNPLSYRFPAGRLADVLEDVAPEVVVFEAATREAVANARGDPEVPTYLYVDGEPPAYAMPFYDALAAGADARPEREVGTDDAYDLLYTSGTTGRPKGVVHDHRDLIEHSHLFLAEGGVRRGDIGLSAFPLYHAAEFHGALLPRIHRGIPNVIHRGFDPARVLRAIEAHGVTVLFAPPIGWRALLEAGDDVAADPAPLRLGIYGTAPMPAEVLESGLEMFDADFLQAYGATELGPCCTFLHAAERPAKRGSAGLPAIDHDLRIVEPGSDPGDELPRGETGEILVAGPATMREYWNRPAATADSLREAGGREWYYTGDLGYFDPDGYLHVVDRTDDLVVSGGENVYPSEVENVLESHPGVRAAAVVGESDEEWGERVVAYIHGATTAAELDRHLRDDDSLADFKRPRRYYFVEDLPTDASGKVRRASLREDGPDVDPEFPS